jgi:type IV pilus assembly protein PilB
MAAQPTHFSALGRALVQHGRLVQADAAAIQAEAGRAGLSFVQQLVVSKKLSAREVSLFAAQTFGYPLLDLNAVDLDQLPVNLIDPKLVSSHRVVALGKRGNRVFVAMSDPSNEQVLQEVKFATGMTMEPVVVEDDKLATVVRKLTESTAKSIEIAAEDVDLSGIEVTDGDAQPEIVTEEIDDAPVVRYVQKILLDAINGGASDIHFEPYEKFYRIRYRTDGILYDVAQPPLAIKEKIASRIKVVSKLDISEKRVPQDGRFALTVDGRRVDIRVVTLPLVYGEGVVMRILDKGTVIAGLESLGMPEHALAQFKSAVNKPNGAVLVTGPTGSGKSTTLYAALNELNDGERSILTIEDPVEQRIAGIKQMQIAPKAGVTFDVGLRSMLRADPDVIMVGEIRDAETAHISVEAALTGHLVLTTLHTRDAPSALGRLIDMGIEPFLVSSAVDCIIAQRLVRLLCKHCKKPQKVSDAVLAEHGLTGAEPFEAVGCSRCGGSGYRGRVGVYEAMTVSEQIRALILERASVDAMVAVAVGEGMRRLRDDGLEKVREGFTSIAEVERMTNSML